jgi:hypothetical protein
MRVTLLYKEHLEQHMALGDTNSRSLVLFRIEGARTVIYRSIDRWIGENRDSSQLPTAKTVGL